MSTQTVAKHKFIWSNPNTPATTVEVTGNVVKIGRDVKAHISITGDDTVARMHCVAEFNTDGACVIDLGSGTCIVKKNRAIDKINKEKLDLEDHIIVGNTTIQYVESTVSQPIANDLPLKPLTPTKQETVKQPTAVSNVKPATKPVVVVPAVSNNSVFETILSNVESRAKKLVAQAVRYVLKIEREN